MRRLPLIGTVLLALAAGCSPTQSLTDSGSMTMDMTPVDSGSTPPPEDSGPVFICADMQQQGNEDGVGQFCNNSGDCPTAAPICALQWKSLLGNPAIPKANVCLSPNCDPCWDIQQQCGSNAACVCFGVNECACAPTFCTVFVGPADAGIVCPADAGPPDSGMEDAGTVDAGPVEDAGAVDAGLVDAGHH